MGGDDRGRARSNSSKSVGIIQVRQSMTRKPVDSCKQAAGVFGPVVSLKRCEGKGDCVEVCPEHVFRVQRIEVTACPEQAITLRRRDAEC
jgi:ferredoxin